MEVTFRTKRLRDYYRDSRVAVRELGKDLALKYIRRIDMFLGVERVPDLLRIPGYRCHALKGERTGQWAVSLDNFHRLIFTIRDERMEVVNIEEISKHYGN